MNAQMTNAHPRGLGAAEEAEVRAARPAYPFVLIPVLAALALAALAMSPLFSIRSVVVVGAEYYGADEIARRSGLSEGQNGFRALAAGGGSILDALCLRYGGAERGIAAACPYVKDVAARYEPPWTVRIEVEERTTSIVAPLMDSGLLVDEEGYVVDIIKDYRQSDLPVVLGVELARYALGEKLAVQDAPRFEAALGVIAAVRQQDQGSERDMGADVASIDVTDMQDVRLALKSGLVLKLGDLSDVHYQLTFAREIVYGSLAAGSKGVLDLSTGSRPVYMPDGAP